MKKEYMKPAQEVVNVVIDKMLLDTSDPNVVVDRDGRSDPDGFDSRGDSYWDYDD